MPRPYESSHPWLRFALDFRQIPWDIWVLLGECQSKCEHIAGTPLRPEISENLHRIYLAKGVAATTAIEGNTLSEEQVRRQMEGTLTVPPSKQYLQQEIENIIEGCNGILEQIASGHLPVLSADRICELNRLVLRKLQSGDDLATPGEFRRYSVGVADYRGAPNEDCAFLVDRLCSWLNGMEFPKDQEILGATLKAIVAHLYLAWIHPFGDGNGRTARMVELQILLCSGVPAPAAQLLSNHYNQTRSEYYRQLQRSSKSGGDLIPFVRYAVQGLRDGLAEQIDLIRAQHIEVAWINYVHDTFRGLNGDADVRRRTAILEIYAANKDWIVADDITALTPRLAQQYGNKSAKTVARDLDRLVELGLLQRKDKQVRANRNVILAFLPTRAVLPPQAG